MTFRARMILLFVTFLGGILLFLSVLRHQALWSLLMAVERDEVRSKVQQIHDYIADLAEQAREEHTPMDVRPQVLLPDAIAANGMYIQLVGTDGKVWAKSSNLGYLQLPFTNRAGFSTIVLSLPHTAGQPHLLMMSHYLDIPGVPIAQVQVADVLKPIERTMDQQLAINVASEIVGLLMAGLAGFYLASWTLRPIMGLTAQVNDIEAKDLRRRVDTTGLADDEIGKLAATFNRLLDRLEAAFISQQRFIADASHELRTPLTAIAGHAQLLLKRGRTDPTLFEMPLQTILKETDRLTRLVNDLLLMARSETPVTRRERLDVAALALDVGKEYAVLHRSVRVVPAQAPLWVDGDPDAIRRVFVNLLDNALKAITAEGSVKVISAESSGQAQVLIEDDGCGISAAHQEHIFDRFYRVDAARARQVGGSGLGLAIVKAIVQAHQGTITLDSAEGKGTRVSVRLPLAAGATTRHLG